MKSAVYFFLGLVLGAAGGAYIATAISEKKAESKIEEATIEARDYYKEKYSKQEEKLDEKVEKKVGERLTRLYGKTFDVYSSPAVNIDDVVVRTGAKVADEEDDFKNRHYITPISSSEYDDEEEYTKCSLDCYADGTVTDEMGNDVEDPGSIIGSDTIDDLDPENRVAYVRNDATRTVYEICYIDTYYEPEGGIDD